jgi:hypothetical protein
VWLVIGEAGKACRDERQPGIAGGNRGDVPAPTSTSATEGRDRQMVWEKAVPIEASLERWRSAHRPPKSR